MIYSLLNNSNFSEVLALVFSSLFFLCVFLPVCLLLYYIVDNRTYRNIVLIITSLLFYAWGEPLWVTVLIFSAIFDYFNGKYAEKYRGTIKGAGFVALSVVGNLSILIFFKYSGFIVDNINSLFNANIDIPRYSLPIGISFYTFQTISYVIDVYRGEVEAQKSPYKLLLFVSLFHQLVAGPIVRYKDIAYEIDNRKETFESFNIGVQRFIVGLGKKVIIANTAGELSKAFLDTDYSRLSTLGAWFGILLFAFQIYFDFSGYSDMAIGLGKMFGFTYKENFDYPYISKSATEFWRRWHMSLGSFFRDYVYIPLGGNRKNLLRNLFVVWFLTCLWHGASWNFIVWGLYYFALILIEKLFLSKLLSKLPAALSRIYLIIAVLVGWVFFYHTDLTMAFSYIGVMLGINADGFLSSEVILTFNENLLFVILAVFACTPIIKYVNKFFTLLSKKIKIAPFYEKALQPIIKVLILIITLVFLVGQSYNPFLYFRL